MPFQEQPLTPDDFDLPRLPACKRRLWLHDAPAVQHQPSRNRRWNDHVDERTVQRRQHRYHVGYGLGRGSGACGSPTQREGYRHVRRRLGTGPQFLLWGLGASPPERSRRGCRTGARVSGLAAVSNEAPVFARQDRRHQPERRYQVGDSSPCRKVVDSGSATPDQWCFNISPNPNGETLPKCPASGGNTVTFAGLSTG